MDEEYDYDDNIRGTDFKDRDRFGLPSSEEGNIGNIGKFNKRFLSDDEDDEDKFMQKFGEHRVELDIILVEKDMDIIKRIVKTDPRIKFKNPLAFLLGYMVVSRDKIIQKKYVDEMYNLCDGFRKKVDIVTFNNIRKVDIVRYARFIVKYV